MAATYKESTLITIQKSYLLWIYIIVPIVFLIVVLDIAFFDQTLKKTLPASPEKILIFSIFFELPHIVASSFSFLDHKMVHTYKKKITYGIPTIILLSTLFSRWINISLFSVIFYTITAKHMAYQQAGVVQLVTDVRNVWSKIWKISTLAFAVIIQFGVAYLIPKNIHLNYVSVLLVFFIVTIFTISSLMILSHSKSRIGKLFIISNNLSLFCVLLCYAWSYFYFVILIPRIIHDLTAFLFAAIHDHNKNLKSNSNLLYRSFKRSGLPVLLLSPILAILITVPLTLYKHSHVYSNQDILFNIIIGLHLFHYYTDSFTWKSSSPHRQWVPIST